VLAGGIAAATRKTFNFKMTNKKKKKSFFFFFGFLVLWLVVFISVRIPKEKKKTMTDRDVRGTRFQTFYLTSHRDVYPSDNWAKTLLSENREHRPRRVDAAASPVQQSILGSNLWQINQPVRPGSSKIDTSSHYQNHIEGLVNQQPLRRLPLLQTNDTFFHRYRLPIAPRFKLIKPAKFDPTVLPGGTILDAPSPFVGPQNPTTGLYSQKPIHASLVPKAQGIYFPTLPQENPPRVSTSF
jgi:hypothetical protein